MKKVPFSEYASIEGEGVNIQWGDPTDAGALPDGPFDVVYDNNGKSLDVCQPAIDKYKVCTIHLYNHCQHGIDTSHLHPV